MVWRAFSFKAEISTLRSNTSPPLIPTVRARRSRILGTFPIWFSICTLPIFAAKASHIYTLILTQSIGTCLPVIWALLGILTLLICAVGSVAITLFLAYEWSFMARSIKIIHNAFILTWWTLLNKINSWSVCFNSTIFWRLGNKIVDNWTSFIVRSRLCTKFSLGVLILWACIYIRFCIVNRSTWNALTIHAILSSLA